MAEVRGETLGRSSEVVRERRFFVLEGGTVLTTVQAESEAEKKDRDPTPERKRERRWFERETWFHVMMMFIVTITAR